MLLTDQAILDEQLEIVFQIRPEKNCITRFRVFEYPPCPPTGESCASDRILVELRIIKNKSLDGGGLVCFARRQLCR